uniref:Topoisomerase 6 subunit A/Spo11 TOPRIM domain-containing protein n=1 Tax=Aegilops tauschii subsp. strangulata TaxID=200361 RepID=A0A453RXB4_AEGTS
MMPRHSSEYGKSWRCATRSWAKGSLSPSGSCSTNYYRTHPSTSAVSAMSIKPSKEPEEEHIDCSILGPSGHAITGDLNQLSRLNLSSDARYLILVEKDAIFQRLAEDRLYNQLPCILITAKGYPDIATRFILHRLSQTFPNMPIFALVDWLSPFKCFFCERKHFLMLICILFWLFVF